MSGVRSLVRNKTVKGFASAASAPIYVDSDDNIVKVIPAGTGSTEVQIVDASSAQTLTNKTLTSPVITGATISANRNVQTVAAAGSVQGDAGAITVSSPGLAFVTGADATKGVVLPAAVAGYDIVVKNDDAANAILKVYPASGDIINALGANNAISMAAKTSALFVALDATTWYTVPLLPS